MGGGVELRAGGRRPDLHLGPRVRAQLHGLLRHDHRQDEEGILQPGINMMLDVMKMETTSDIELGDLDVLHVASNN